MITEVVLRHAAQVINRDGRAKLVVLQSRHLVGDLGDILEPELLERIAVERGHRGAYVLEVLFAFLRGHDDLAELVGGLLRQTQGRQEAERESRREDQTPW